MSAASPPSQFLSEFMFDALHKWLGIPPVEQPPNDYRLLGIATYEADPEVIDGAADKHLAFLHGLANSEHSALAEELSNRISAARLRLLNPTKQAAYDQQLRQATAAAIQTQSTNPAAPNPAPTGIAPLGTAPATGFAPSAPSAPSAPIGVAPSAALGVAPTSPTTIASSDANPPSQYGGPEQGQPAAPAIRKSVPAAKRAKAALRTKSWRYTVLPGAVALLVLLGLIAMGKLRLDRDKMVAIGIPEEMAESVANLPDATNDAAKQSGDAPGQPSTTTDTSTTGSTAPNTQSPGNMRPGETGTSSGTPSSNSSTGNPSQASPSNGQSNPSPSSQPETSDSPAFRPPEPRTSGMGSLMDDPKKSPVPSAAEIEKKLKVVRTIYEEEYRAAKTKDEKETLANKMLDVVDESRGDAAGQFALMRVARDIFMGMHEYDNALDTVDQMTDYFDDVDVIQLKSEPLAMLKSVAVGKSTQYIDAVFSIAHQSLDEGKNQIGRALLDRAADKLSSGIPSSRAKEFEALKSDLGNASELQQRYQTDVKTLQTNSDDPEAATSVGRYLCLAENRWTDGLPHLAKGSDVALREAAQLDLAFRPGNDNELAIAEAWYRVATQDIGPLEKRRSYDRAWRWYSAAKATGKGLEAVQVDRRLKEITPYTTQTRLSAFQSGATSRTARRQRVRRQVKLLQQKTWDSDEYTTDFARINPGPVIVLGMGTGGYYGETCAGLELDGATKIRVDGGQVQQTAISYNSRTRIGFMVDYHTPQGYSKRVFLEVAGSSAIDYTSIPEWGRGAQPDQAIRIGARGRYEFDLKNWAPSDWDGKSWFSIYMKDGGRERALQAVVSWAL